MTNKTKAPTAATTEAKGTGEHLNHEANPCPCIVPQETQPVKDYGPIGATILPHLRSGRGNARKKPEFLAATGLRDREFRKGVEGLRRAGVVICADEKGYYLPATLYEVQGYIRQEEARARSTFFTLQSARQMEAVLLAGGEQMQIPV